MVTLGQLTTADWLLIIKQHSLSSCFVYNANFTSSHWNSLTQTHTVTFSRAGLNDLAIEADVLIAATGALNKPVIPHLPGRDSFEGTQFHSSRWNHDVDLRGKRVAVVGIGSSGIQSVPHLAKLEGVTLTQFMRSPGHFRPKVNRKPGAVWTELRDLTTLPLLTPALPSPPPQANSQRCRSGLSAGSRWRSGSTGGPSSLSTTV